MVEGAADDVERILGTVDARLDVAGAEEEATATATDADEIDEVTAPDDDEMAFESMA